MVSEASGQLILILALQTVALAVIAGALVFVALRAAHLLNKVSQLIGQISAVVVRVDRLVKEIEQREMVGESAALINSLTKAGEELTKLTALLGRVASSMNFLVGESPSSTIQRSFKVVRIVEAIGEGIAAGLKELRASGNKQPKDSPQERE